MLRFVLRRLAAGVVLVVVIAVATFFLLHAAGGDIGRRILGQTASAETVQFKNQQLGLDQPLLSQFGHWLSGAVRGDLGTSWFSGQPVVDAITSRTAVTLSLVIGATLVTAVIAVLLGVLAAQRGGWVDRVVQLASVLGTAVPGFLVAIGLVLVFAIDLGWFEPTGYTSLSDSAGGWLAAITLPVLALSIGSIASVTQQVRGAMLDALRQDWVRTLRSRGLPESRVVYEHVLRNAAGPALSVLAVQFIALIGGAIFVETIFAIPGLGQVAVGATSQGDIPLVLGLVIAVSLLVVVVNLVVDLLQGWLNPKVRRA
ncbi:ABC transporter permease subunit [Modestobacter sp. I12A-02628]|uniref:ABC transporter permease n=1 Tax=Goekera deserti TaxID=2497753 RepID=A0A7K3WG80_9ACTN|nr:ABC transporter permease [Goekera deserti]MPQ96584.1 ABC transporter permease subunit [Goekera deserti]NDI47104.1 ABC transporter permease subunit [Goekera deserti]NEL55498.1 ABC transporter permease [Goekera deserti]